MYNQLAYELGAAPSCIRDLAAYGDQRANIVGKDNVFDFSIGNPSIPAPKEVNDTVAAIKAIKLIPDKVTLEDIGFVKAARAAYDKIATLEQKALVTNYADLVSAEQRIASLTPATDEQTEQSSGGGLIIFIVVVLIAALLGFVIFRNYQENKREKLQRTN